MIQDELDMQDLMLEIQAEIDEIVQELLGDLTTPQARRALSAKMAAIKPEVKEVLSQKYPEQMEQVSRLAQQPQ